MRDRRQHNLHRRFRSRPQRTCTSNSHNIPDKQKRRPQARRAHPSASTDRGSDSNALRSPRTRIASQKKRRPQ
jgi:hypothetical protein